MFKIGAVFVILCSLILIKSTVSSSDKYSLCERQSSKSHDIVHFKCPEERVWFPTTFFSSTSSESDKKYCCGTIYSRYCCNKSEFKKELYLRQRSNYGMSEIAVPLIIIAAFAIMICICCRCISMCFGKKRMNRGTIITSTSTQAGNINGQNVHVIGQPPAHTPNPTYQQNFYTPAQYPPNQYPPPTSFASNQFTSNQYDPSTFDYNVPPPQYTPQPVAYPNPYKTETNQKSANENSLINPSAPQPSAPEF